MKSRAHMHRLSIPVWILIAIATTIILAALYTFSIGQISNLGNQIVWLNDELNRERRANKPTTQPTTATQTIPTVTLKGPESLRFHTDSSETYNRDLPFTLQYPEAYLPYVTYYTVASGSGFDIHIYKGEIGELQIQEKSVVPESWGYSGEEFDNVSAAKRADVVDRAFPKETKEITVGKKKFLLSFYYRKGDVTTKQELLAIADSIREI